MLIQRRETVNRLIRQHDHALLAGALAFRWRTLPGGELSLKTALATALHDVVWEEEDRRPRLDPEAGLPYDFTSIPPSLKQGFVLRGVERLAFLDPDVAELVGAHHRSLAEDTPVDPASELAWLRFFDNLSLFVCLTPPGSLVQLRPRWLVTSTLRPPRGAELSLRWNGPDELSLDPFPFGARFCVPVPYRDLPTGSFDEDALQRAWGRAVEERWSVTFAPGAPDHR